VQPLSPETVAARPLADAGKRGLVVRLDRVARRTVDGVHRNVLVTVHPSTSDDEVIRTLRELADKIEAAEA
jgi:CBS domain-containing protein